MRPARAGAGRRLPAALHVDTGMCRLGFAEAELEALDPALLDALELRLVMSHLACAEEPANPLNEQQRARFERLRALLPPAPASLANSSGIFLGPAFHSTSAGRAWRSTASIRPRAGANPMAPVVTLEAPVLQVHDVAGAAARSAMARPTRPGAGTPHRDRAGRLCRRLSARRERPRGRAHRRHGGAARRAGCRWTSSALDVSALPPDAVRPGTMVELIGGPDGLDELGRGAPARSATRC